MKVSYLITCSTETDTLKRLLDRVFHIVDSDDNHQDEIQLLIDAKHPMGDDVPDDTAAIIYDYSGYARVYWNVHSLDNNYGAHKNFGIEKCNGDYIFQIDGDEMPPETLLGDNLHAFLESNPTTEAFAIPRINDFRGVTLAHAAQWGWRLTESPTYKRPIVNFPDFQFRIFKKDYPRISFTRRLHEKIEGYSSFVCLPADEEYALYHDKTIETQIATNLRYNQKFTEDENKGHGVFK